MELSKTTIKKLYGAVVVLFFMLVIAAVPMKKVEAAVPPGIITINGNVTPQSYNDLIYYLNLIDKNDSALMKSFVDNGWKIVLTAEDLNTTKFNGQQPGVQGYTDYNGKTIYVQSGSYVYCVLHEMGHYLDFITGNNSMTPNFSMIYNVERANLTTYGGMSPSEFFAEVFMYLYLNPGKVTSSCPYAAQYVSYIRMLPAPAGWYM
ncbi:MAG: hypothetical protein K6A69_07440 [Lachnospiraceae bacterium]|nr:hypothetical protein [Lachnospiraceae bacterium]